MAIDKALNQAPLGLSEMVEDMEPAIEIEIEDPESVSIKAGDLEIVLEKEDMDDEFNENLAENLEDDVLTELAGDLLGEFQSDIDSRKDWVQTYVDGLELLGLKIEERTEPWPGACGVYHPLLSEAIVKVPVRNNHGDFPCGRSCEDFYPGPRNSGEG
jgi:hypothetical protein